MGKLNNIILCLLGKSGSGKSTIADKLHDEYGYSVLQSYTTRKPRYDNETGHRFVDLQIFEALPNKVAYNEYNGNHYCATQSQIEEDDIYVVDCHGLKQLREKYKGSKKIVAIYINVPMEVRLERMCNRGDSENSCWDRLRFDEAEFKGVKGEVNYIVNGIPNSTWSEVLCILQREESGKSEYQCLD